MKEENHVQKTQRTINAVSLQIPQFTETIASTWFIILEAQFKTNKVAAETAQFYHALGHLPPEVVVRLSPAEATSKNYTALKDAVINFFSQSNVEMFHQ